MVTAEFAVALPAFVLVVLAALAGIAVVTAQLRCVDAAAAAARLAARGEPAATVTAAGHTDLPGDSRVTVSRQAGLVSVTVAAWLRPPGALGALLPAVPVHAQMVQAIEPGVAVAR